jgi:hypothetical protein
MEYHDVNRGVIQNRERAKQIIDFSGLKFGKITPTDIDGLIEYQDKAIIFMEYKYSNALMPYGQKLALERLADNSQKAGKQSVVLVCEHDVSDCDSDIIEDKAVVREFYYCRHWYHDGSTIVIDKIRSFLNFVNQQYL